MFVKMRLLWKYQALNMAIRCAHVKFPIAYKFQIKWSRLASFLKYCKILETVKVKRGLIKHVLPA